MSIGHILSPTAISASGLAAERRRMEVVANNIANANSTQSVDGGPYRRQQVVFAAMVDDSGGAADGMGVRVVGVQQDMSELPQVYDPGHPHANADGFVAMPNVQLPLEMVDLMTAGRSYEANLKALQTFRQMAEQALSVLRGMG